MSPAAPRSTPVATCHFERTVHTTTGKGGSVEKAYSISREEAKVGSLDRSIPTARSGEDLLSKEVLNMPDWAQGNATTFFRAAEQHERVKAPPPHSSRLDSGLLMAIGLGELRRLVEILQTSADDLTGLSSDPGDIPEAR
jgi:hypothetical protein